MPKLKVSPSDRTIEFKNDGFYLCDGNLMCRYCNCRLEHERRDTLVKHVASEKHKKAKVSLNSSAKRQISIAESLEVGKKFKNDKEEFLAKTTEAFISANIPIEKLNHPKLREWFSEYVKGGGDLPTAEWLRIKYIPIIAEQKRQDIKAAISNKPVAVLSDETTDRGGRCVFNIVFKTLEPSTTQNVFLAASVVLDCADSSSCARAIVDTLQKYEVDYALVSAFVSDSARYMTKCAKTLEGLFGDNFLHVQCWAHKIHLVGVVWQTHLEELNTTVVKVKNAFLNTRKRKHQYLEFLKTKYPADPTKQKLFPQPIVTRWNTWFEAAVYLNEHFQDIVEFFEQFSEHNSGIKFLNKMSVNDVAIVKIQGMFVAENCTHLTELIVYLEGSSYPTAHMLASKIKNLQNKFDLLSKGVFSSSVNDRLSHLSTVVQAKVKLHLQLTAKKCETKLSELVQNDPSRKTFEGIDALFNPRNVSRMNIHTSDFNKHIQKLPKMSQLPTDVFVEGYQVFKQIIEEDLSNPASKCVDVAKILCALKGDYHDFSQAGLKAIWFPTSNVDCERSFSKYSLVVSDRRHNLKPENAESLTMLTFQ